MKKNSILNRLIKAAFIVCLIPLLVFFLVTYTFVNKSVSETAMDYNFKINSLISHSFTEFAKRLENVCYSISTGPIPNALDVCAQNKNTTEAIRAKIEINNIISQQINYTGLSTIVSNFCIISSDGELIYDNSNTVSSTFFRKNPVYLQKHTTSFFTDIYPSGKRNEPTFSFVKKLKLDSNHYANDVFVIMDLNMSNIGSIFDYFLTDKNNSVFLTDSKEKIIYQNNRSVSFAQFTKAAAQLKDESYKRIKDGNETYIISRYNTDYSGITAYTTSVVTEHVQVNSVLLKIYILSFLLSILIAITLNIIITRGIAKPIRILKDTMEKAVDGNFEIEVPDLGKDEIGDLGICFSNLLKTINTLINENYKICIEQKNAQIKSLQMQINPHFLYNTLETINSIALCNDIESISDISMAMAKICRYSVKHNNRIVTVGDELTHVNNYLTIIKIRFEDHIIIHTQIDDAVLDKPCIKFILQPLVENSMAHAFENSNKQNSIMLNAYLTEKDVCVEIEDNGCGIDNAMLEKIYQAMDSNIEPSSHIGIANVHQRIRLTYGSEYGVEIHTSDLGTKFTVHLPLNHVTNEPNH